MKKLSKNIITFVLAVVFMAQCLCFSQSLNSFTASAEDLSDSTLTYSYLYNAPVGVAASENLLYILDNIGGVFKYDMDSKAITALSQDSASTLLSASSGGAVTEGGSFKGIATTASGLVYVIDSNEIFARAGNVYTPLGIVFSGNLSAIAAYGNKLYVCEENSGVFSIYSISASTKTLIKSNLKADGEISAIAVMEDESVYYATPYSLYKLGDSSGYSVGGITSLSAFGSELYFALRSAKVCKWVDGEQTVLLCASEDVSLSSRRGTVVVTDYGNNRVEVVRESSKQVLHVEQPMSAAIDYFGNIYVASGNAVNVYSKGMELVDTVYPASGTLPIVELKVDLSDLTGNALYGVTADGRLFNQKGGHEAVGFVDVEVSQVGEIYAMRASGEIVKLDSSLTVTETIMTVSGAVDFALDGAGNVFLATDDALYKNTSQITAYSGMGVKGISISAVSFKGSNRSVGHGDVIVISSLKGGIEVVSAAVSQTEMNSDSEKSEYTAFIAAIDSDTPNPSTSPSHLRRVAFAAELYPVPLEVPVASNRELSIGTNVIVLGDYPSSSYCYVIAECATGSQKGFVSKQILSDLLEYKKLYAENTATAISSIRIYKYPSTSAPEIGSAVMGAALTLLDFADGYKDWASSQWCRVLFDGQYEGFVLRGSVAIGGSTGGQVVQLIYNGEIKASRDEVETYLDTNGTRLGTIKNGTKIRLNEEFTKSKTYTNITYETDSGAQVTCYVLTEYIKYTDTSSYQIIFFFIGMVSVAAVAVIIIVSALKKRRIEG